jgi:uncharacterized lipoprotein NlpE involved in copper resistance
MRTQGTAIISIVIFVFTLLGVDVQAADKYKRGGKSKDEASQATPTATAEGAEISVKTESKSSKKDDKVDVKDLEERYWTAKDTEFKVVQNRLYTKEKKFSLTPMAGPCPIICNEK